MHIAQQMPLPLTISCSSKSRLALTFLVLPFWYLLTRVVPDIFQKSSKMAVCVCVSPTSMYNYRRLKQQLMANTAVIHGWMFTDDSKWLTNKHRVVVVVAAVAVITVIILTTSYCMSIISRHSAQTTTGKSITRMQQQIITPDLDFICLQCFDAVGCLFTTSKSGFWGNMTP